jgi:hypothetical protein
MLTISWTKEHCDGYANPSQSYRIEHSTSTLVAADTHSPFQIHLLVHNLFWGYLEFSGLGKESLFSRAQLLLEGGLCLLQL